MSQCLWIFEGAYVGQASRLTSNDLPTQARRLRYIPEVQKQLDFGINPKTDFEEDRLVREG
jgi:hypothetical protein